jgi:hypothetical protein
LVGDTETILALAACSTFSNFPQNGDSGNFAAIKQGSRTPELSENATFQTVRFHLSGEPVFTDK